MPIGYARLKPQAGKDSGRFDSSPCLQHQNSTDMATIATVTQDWDNDGTLVISNAQTLQRYLELKEINRNAPMDEFGIFFAFSKQQFEEGYNKLVQSGKITYGDKVQRGPGGSFGIKGAFDKLDEFYNTQDEMVKKECNPQEVYWYEYNNYECCIDYDGDKRAIQFIIETFGEQAARSVKRFRAYYSIDEILKDEN